MEQVAKTNENTVVVVNSVGPINMEGWVTNPNVTAIVSRRSHIDPAACFVNGILGNRYGAGFPAKKQASHPLP